MPSPSRLLPIVLIIIGFSLLSNLAINQTAAVPGLSSLDVLHAYDFAWIDQTMDSTSNSTNLLNSTSTSSGQSRISSIASAVTQFPTTFTSSTTSTTTNFVQTSTTSTTAVTVSLAQNTNGSSTSSTTGSTQTVTTSTTTNTTLTLAGTMSSTQTTLSTSSSASSTTINSAAPAATQNDGYSISFNPPYWLCTNVQVTFTGPLVESGFYGDTLQFQYFQYNPSYPSVLNTIFTDPGLTVTSDTVSYWISYNEYGQVNFVYMPNIAVKVVDVTPKSNGYIPGQIFFDLTNINPEGYQSCPYGPPPVPEFQVDWMVIMISVALSLVFFQAHKRKAQS